jgi:hypothetical protein
MAVLTVPELGAQARWMRQALLVAALAEAAEPGAERAVPGASRWVEPWGLVVLGP